MGLFKKICKEICRPFRQGSRGIGRAMKFIGGKSFGNFMERAFNTILDTIAVVGASIYGGPIGVASINAILAGSYNLSDKDIFKASILGGASAFVSNLSNELIIAKGLGIKTVAVNGILNGTVSVASGQNVINGIAYGYGGLICPANPLLVASIKTIAEKDIEVGILHIVGFETGKYVQAYINTTKAIDKQIKEENKEIFGINQQKVSNDRITNSIKKDVELYNLVKNELIEPYKESLKTHYVNSDKKIKHIFNSVHEKINDSMWNLKTSIAIKTNKINNQLIYKISPNHGLAMTADVNKHLNIGLKDDNWSISSGFSNVYPRGFVVKYAVNTLQYNSDTIDLTVDHSIKENKGYCFTSKIYNTTSNNSSKLTTEYHINADCVALAGIGATATVIAPQIMIPAFGTMVTVPAFAIASENDVEDNKTIKINKKSLSYKINSGNNPKLNYKIGEMLKDCGIIN